jgi:CubicO group peptidase (beta-lactamase class C family)
MCEFRYPIGSNTKLFTAVSAWQLHCAGKLSVYDPASKYLNTTELGLDGPWCPRVYNTTGEPTGIGRPAAGSELSPGLGAP